jgi:signal transduction histidine kinase
MHLRRNVEVISASWERAVMERLPQLHELERASVVDHLPEFLYGLAAWVEGDEETGIRGFEALVRGHALQRLGHGISLETLSIEYQVLRTTILQQLLDVESTREVTASLIRLNAGIDHAVDQAVHRYTAGREQVRERFVSVLGHDLRNPLEAITLASSSIASLPCTQDQHVRMAEMIQRSSARMARMISDIIDLAHAHLGEGIPSIPRRCNMGEICEEAAHELRLAHPDRTIELSTSGDLEGYWDRDRAIQAISNLIGNAVQHGSDPIVVEAVEAGDRTAVITRVKNRGSAIPAERLAQLFDPFQHGPERPMGAHAGLGLGLFIVQQIALSHGGVCEVESTAQETKFAITWPRVSVEKMSDRE